MAEKVFCDDCKFLFNLDNHYLCKEGASKVNTWLKKEVVYDDPSEKNKNNNCKGYKHK